MKHKEWHDVLSDGHITGHMDPMFRKCRHCGDAHPDYIAHCPLTTLVEGDQLDYDGNVYGTVSAYVLLSNKTGV